MKTPSEEEVARIIWQAHMSPNASWEARLKWVRTTPAEREYAISRGTHPDNFDCEDVDNAFTAARLVLALLQDER